MRAAAFSGFNFCFAYGCRGRSSFASLSTLAIGVSAGFIAGRKWWALSDEPTEAVPTKQSDRALLRVLISTAQLTREQAYERFPDMSGECGYAIWQDLIADGIIPRECWFSRSLADDAGVLARQLVTRNEIRKHNVCEDVVTLIGEFLGSEQEIGNHNKNGCLLESQRLDHYSPSHGSEIDIFQSATNIGFKILSTLKY